MEKLKCKYFLFKSINEDLNVIVNEEKQPIESEIENWIYYHKIIDFASREDLSKVRAFAISKHYQSDSCRPHTYAIKQGIEVDCVEIIYSESKCKYLAHFKEKKDK